MSYFSIGGNLGYALGPALATPLIVWQGLRGGLVLAVPCLVIAFVLLRSASYLQSFATEERHPARRGGRDRPRALATLLGVICFRSIAWFGLVTFVPLWEVSLGHSKAYGNHLLSVMLLAGVVGTLVAGPLADRIGLRPVLLGSLIATPPLIAVFIGVGGIPGAFALALVGCCVIGTFGVTMVMSQQYLPSRIGMASGLSIGMSIGLGGIAAVGLGAIADSIDLRAALWVCAVAPLAAFALAVLLPRAGRRVEPELVAAS
jgi:FSR family fosmidomycin resistance protein-like MFS transporter